MDKYHLIFDNPTLFKDYFIEKGKTLEHIPNVNNINIILGANNSGKSRFIRDILLSNKFKKIDEHLFSEYKKLLEKIRSDNRFNSKRYNEPLREVVPNENFFIDISANLSLIRSHKGSIFDHYFSQMESLVKELNDRKNINFLKKYYIPTLRTAHSLFEFNEIEKQNNKIQRDVFKDTLVINYKNDFKGIDVFTGLDLYEQILDTRNSIKETREKFQDFERFLSLNFFESKNIDIVAEFKYDENKRGKNESELISIHIEGEKDTRKLYELGDGVQALIILMYKIFMAESNSMIVIDEPELNLHPGMQRLFLEQITTNQELDKKNLTYFITTHSNHFLDLTIEEENVSIYSFNSILGENGTKKFQIKNVNAGNNEILQSLGVNNSSVFMANCSIWVEGISDRNYIKAFLKSYCESRNELLPKEDIDFAFFEYAGSNIDHYLFNKDFEEDDTENIITDINALALNNRIFLLADSDATTETSNPSKYDRLKRIENSKKNQFIPKIIWEVREIENLITNEIWDKILINFCNQKLLKKNKDLIQEKITNALKLIDYESFKAEYIGNFLNRLRKEVGEIDGVFIINESIYEKKEKEKKFGTLTNKRYLSELILKENFSWEVFKKNKQIEVLTVEIYNFIKNKK